jgi:hypothetical protein
MRNRQAWESHCRVISCVVGLLFVLKAASAQVEEAKTSRQTNRKTHLLWANSTLASKGEDK